MLLVDLLMFVLGLVLLTAGAEGLVRGAARLAERFGISPLIVGLTVVALGTSSPETAVSVQSAWAGQPEIALGNIIGSNITNVLLILGLSALVAPLLVSRRLVRWDVPIMIAASFLTVALCLDRRVGRLDGFILLAMLAGYMIFLVREAMSERLDQNAPGREEVDGTVLTDLLWTGAGLALLVVGSRWLVNGAVAFAEMLGVSKLVIGLTVVAVGTSLPELATSVVAAIRGERDIAVGNIVGSNIFNLLFVLGLAAVAAPAPIEVPEAAMQFDFTVMLIVAVACMPIFFIGATIDRWEGSLFFTYYVLYVIWLVLSAMQHPAFPAFREIMLLFVLPATAVLYLIGVWRSLRPRPGAEAG
jgi:cation:H+ antiporter